MLGKIEGRRRKGWQRMRWLDSITDSMDMSLSELWKIVKEGQGSLGCCRPWGYRVRHNLATEQQQLKRLRSGGEVSFAVDWSRHLLSSEWSSGIALPALPVLAVGPHVVPSSPGAVVSTSAACSQLPWEEGGWC